MPNFAAGFCQIGRGFYFIAVSCARLFGYQPPQKTTAHLTGQQLAQIDAKNLARDWQQVGDDLRQAMGYPTTAQFEQEQKSHQS